MTANRPKPLWCCAPKTAKKFFLSITDELREALQGEPVETPEEEPAAPAISLAKPTKPEPVEETKIRPAEIQNRIRAGASAAELAEEMGVTESRIEPFAYPVMLERNRIAEIAKQAHPSARTDRPNSPCGRFWPPPLPPADTRSPSPAGTPTATRARPGSCA